ncbi:otolin-1-like [Mercenaria mercenaria]|uniref:otolin-1-like n=1 Tax=Mercenaria mercenaria TaxID=6596 RepID=UPI00234E631B|nr:otolin-1-like [Mercenaria mercenaria]
MLQIQVLLSMFVFSSASSATSDFRNPIDSVENSIGISTETLIKTVVDMANKIKTLEAKVEKLERLEDKMMSLEETLLLKNEKIAKMERVMETLVTKRNNSGSKSSTGPVVTSKDKQSLSSHINRGIRQVENVAFSAVLTNSLQHLGDKQAIKFNKILVNDGNGYEPNTGAFTAPMAGTYLFIYNFGHHGTGETWLELVKNGAAQNGVAVEGHFGSQNLQGGNAANIRLDLGDTVWVETYQVSDVTVQNSFTTFSGVFLY